jgi:hypothetical protein
LTIAQRRAAEAAAEVAAVGRLLVEVQAHAAEIAAFEKASDTAGRLDSELTASMVEAFAIIEHQRGALAGLHAAAAAKFTAIPQGIRAAVEQPALAWLLSETETVADRVARLPVLRAAVSA